jgi:predicted nucleic acid-binding protein
LRILVDTSVWIDHLRRTNPQLVDLLNKGEVAIHPFVVGELACGNMRNRVEILRLLSALPETPEVEHGEALRFVEDEKLHGQGLGWVDINLLASSRLQGVGLWSFDKTLAAAAPRLGIAGV